MRKTTFQKTTFALMLGVLCTGFCDGGIASAEIVLPPREVTAGSIYNQQNPNVPIEPKVSPDSVTVETTQYKPVMKDVEGIKVLVREFKISGDPILTKEAQDFLLQEFKGKEVTFSELNAAADKITQYLRDNDYAVATAYLPVQKIEDGIVEITIVAGKYGAINIDNKSRLKSAIISMLAGAEKPGSYIKLSDIERLSLLLNDMPGVSAKATLSTGKELGTSDLNLNITDAGKLANYSRSLDNYGGYYTGSDQGGLNASWNNAYGLGDRISLRVSSSGSNLWLGAFNYGQPVGRAGGTLGVSYSSVNYTLGKGYASLGATGIANVAGLNYNLPLKRSRLSNLYFTATFNNAILQDDNNIGNQNQAKTINRLILGVNGDSIDNWAGGGSNTYSVAWTNGRASMDSSYSQTLDQALGTGGAYNKYTLTANRNQKVADRLNFWLNFNGQWTNQNLVSFEDISLGGPYSVRAYPVGEGTGDIGWVANGELRWLLPMPEKFPGFLQLAAFYDYGWLKINVNQTVNGYTQPGPNNMILAGYGLGLTWSNPGAYYVNVSYAWKDGNHINSAAPDSEGQLWFNVNFAF